MSYFKVQYDAKNRTFKLIDEKLRKPTEGGSLTQATIPVEETESREILLSVRNFLAQWALVLSNN